METSDRTVSDGGDAEEQHSLRLRALLHDLVRRKGRVEAARELGLDPRTVGACMDGEGMSWRVREALERALKESPGPAAARQRERTGALERRVEALEKGMRNRLSAIEARVAALGRGRSLPLERRRYPELVTRDPAPDDEEVYGAAWPLVEEWREIWNAGHVGTGKGMKWLRIEARVRELEVAMLHEHGLTLPLETMPLHGLDRREQLNWRRQALRDARRSLARRDLLRRVRRALTLARWRDQASFKRGA